MWSAVFQDVNLFPAHAKFFANAQKRFYQYVHRDHYPDIAGSSDFGAEHWGESKFSSAVAPKSLSKSMIFVRLTKLSDHCFEILRQGIMCNAEATIITYSWGGPHGIQSNRNGPRTCVDWHAYDRWSEERAINTSERESFLQTLVSD